MSVSSPTTSGEQTLYAALELSKNSWLLAIQLPDRDNPSLHPIKGGDAEGLIGQTRCGQATSGQGLRSGAEADALLRGGLRRFLAGALPRAAGR